MRLLLTLGFLLLVTVSVWALSGINGQNYVQNGSVKDPWVPTFTHANLSGL